MKKQQNNSNRASALQTTFPAALIFASAIWLASAAPTNPKEAFGQSRLRFHSQGIVANPTLGNYPDTSLPLSTDTTVTPDAAPTKTTSINVSTSTDFNGTLEGDPTTGVVRVTDAHPAGTYTVTVTAFDSSGATATKAFTLTITTPVTCLPVGFAPATSYLTGTFYPGSVAVGDFNRDGKQDLAVVNDSYPSNPNVSIFLGDGAGNFSGPTKFAAGDWPSSVAVGDFNGDGKQDLAVANHFSNNVSILLGDGAGNFSGPTNFAAGLYPNSVAVGDFNGDGKQDLAVASTFWPNLSILLGDGAGHFSAPTNFFLGGNLSSVAVGDFNGDGRQDLAVAGGQVSILFGDGAGNFSAPAVFAAATNPYSVAVGDFNGDGKQDLAVANYGSNDVSILLGDGAGDFSAPTNFPVNGIYPESVVVGDFNGDGNPDLVTGNTSSSVSILFGDGTGNFSAPTTMSTGAWCRSVAVGDFNGDGQQDLAVANYTSTGSVSILLRDCPASQITPTGTSCSQFSSGSAQTLDSLQYQIDHNTQLINRVKPTAFFYWVTVTASAGNNTFRIIQTISGNFNILFAEIGNGSNVFDSDCLRLPRQITQSSDMVTVKFNAPTAGTYSIALKYNSQDLIGEPAPSPEKTVHYDFMTRGVPASTSGLDLVKH